MLVLVRLILYELVSFCKRLMKSVMLVVSDCVNRKVIANWEETTKDDEHQLSSSSTKKIKTVNKISKQSGGDVSTSDSLAHKDT